jgi:hypothetical protein
MRQKWRRHGCHYEARRGRHFGQLTYQSSGHEEIVATHGKTYRTRVRFLAYRLGTVANFAGGFRGSAC